MNKMQMLVNDIAYVSTQRGIIARKLVRERNRWRGAYREAGIDMTPRATNEAVRSVVRHEDRRAWDAVKHLHVNTAIGRRRTARNYRATSRRITEDLRENGWKYPCGHDDMLAEQAHEAHLMAKAILKYHVAIMGV